MLNPQGQICSESSLPLSPGCNTELVSVLYVTGVAGVAGVAG